MNIEAIIVATVVVAAVGLFIGIFLGVAGKKFAVETDEREIAVREALPGNNCGGCGYPGCDGLAAVIAKGEAPVNGCPVGGDPVGKIIAGIMGQEAVETVRRTAFANLVPILSKCNAMLNRLKLHPSMPSKRRSRLRWQALAAALKSCISKPLRQPSRLTKPLRKRPRLSRKSTAAAAK